MISHGKTMLAHEVRNQMQHMGASRVHAQLQHEVQLPAEMQLFTTSNRNTYAAHSFNNTQHINVCYSNQYDNKYTQCDLTTLPIPESIRPQRETEKGQVNKRALDRNYRWVATVSCRTVSRLCHVWKVCLIYQAPGK
jgi:hypothetical protein